MQNILLIICVSSSTHAQNESYRIPTSVASYLQVRSITSVEGQTIDCLPAGTLVQVVSSVPFWREIIYGNNQRGWVAKKYLEPVQIVTEPADTTIPADAFLTIHFVEVGQGDAIWIQTYGEAVDKGRIIIQSHGRRTRLVKALQVRKFAASYFCTPVHLVATPAGC